MKKILLLLLVSAPVFSFSQQLIARSVNTPPIGNIGFYEFQPRGYNPAGSYNYPLIIFLHGAGEKGNGTTQLPKVLSSSFPKLLNAGATMNFIVNGQPQAFLVLIPQLDSLLYTTTWPNAYVTAMIDYAKANLKIDQDKIFLTGWSLGGGGAWQYPSGSIDSANLLAGIIPVSPSPDFRNLCNIAQGRVAVWAHHAVDDLSIPVDTTIYAVNAINNCSPAPAIRALVTIYPSGGHGYVADAAYDTLNNIQYPNMFQWMAGTSRLNTPANNLPPVARAGNDTIISKPSGGTASAVLNGLASIDPNDVIVKYKWVVASGPSSPRLFIQRDSFPSTSVSGLETGNYIFRLTVTDQFGVITFDDVNVSVSEGTLPVDIVSFKGNNIGKANLLSWSVKNEINFDYFEVLHSKDGREFSVIGKVILNRDNGLKTYAFNDDKALPGLNYYKLNMVDKDGKQKLSKIITITNNDNQLFVIQKFPNPVKDKLNLVLDGVTGGTVNILVNDMQGRTLSNTTILKQQISWKGSINVQHLDKGLYILNIQTADGIKQVSTFIKQ